MLGKLILGDGDRERQQRFEAVFAGEPRVDAHLGWEVGSLRTQRIVEASRPAMSILCVNALGMWY